METPDIKQLENLIGKTFGFLKVIEYGGKDTRHKWICECLYKNCGNKINVRANSIKTGNTVSCGCLAKEELIERSIKHGLSNLPEYKIWKDIIKRCYNIKSKSYNNYGGRGITVCEQWKYSFPDFLVDMGKRPSSKHSIDRINNSKEYSFENCRWSLSVEQANNKRNNRFLEHNGISMTAPQWARKLGINVRKIYSKMYKGLTDEQILSCFV